MIDLDDINSLILNIVWEWKILRWRYYVIFLIWCFNFSLPNLIFGIDHKSHFINLLDNSAIYYNIWIWSDLWRQFLDFNLCLLKFSEVMFCYINFSHKGFWKICISLICTQILTFCMHNFNGSFCFSEVLKFRIWDLKFTYIIADNESFLNSNSILRNNYPGQTCNRLPCDEKIIFLHIEGHVFGRRWWRIAIIGNFLYFWGF